MKAAIWEYLMPSDSEKEALWKDCIFVFDTNVLLNLYRYTAAPRDALLSALEGLEKRIWLPHQIASEFAKNRVPVIYETIKVYDDLENAGNSFIESCQTTLHLKSTDEAGKELQNQIHEWFDKQKSKNLLVTEHSKDDILDRLLSLFDGKVGDPFAEKELEEIYAEGKERYEKGIPPGYCDAKKQKEMQTVIMLTEI